MQNQVDLDEAGAGPLAFPAFLQVGRAAVVRGLVRRADRIDHGDQPAVGALANLDILLMMLFTHERRKQGLLRNVVPLGNPGTVPVHQSR